jgi:hypothetical protein
VNENQQERFLALSAATTKLAMATMEWDEARRAYLYTDPYGTAPKCRNCGRVLVEGQTRPWCHRAEDFDDDKPIDCWLPVPE